MGAGSSPGGVELGKVDPGPFPGAVEAGVAGTVAVPPAGEGTPVPAPQAATSMASPAHSATILLCMPFGRQEPLNGSPALQSRFGHWSLALGRGMLSMSPKPTARWS